MRRLNNDVQLFLIFNKFAPPDIYMMYMLIILFLKEYIEHTYEF